MPHSRERGNPERTHPPKQVSSILSPAHRDGPAELHLASAPRARPGSPPPAMRPRSHGRKEPSSAPQLLSPSSRLPLSHRSSRTRLAHLRRQRPPAPPAPAERPRAVPTAALASCPPPFTPRARHGEPGARGCFSCCGRGGNRRGGDEVGGTQRGGPSASAPSLPPARLDPA